MASNQLSEVPTDQRNLVESLGDLSIGKDQGFESQTAGLGRPRSGLARTSSTASSASDVSQGDSGKPFTEKLAEQVRGDAEVTDGRVASKPPSGILQTVTGKISQTVQSAKDAIAKKREQAKPAAGKDGDQGVLVLDEEYTKKVADEASQPSATKDALASAGAAVVGSAVAAKDAVVATVASASEAGKGDGGSVEGEGAAAPAKGGILQTVGTKIAQSAQYVKGALVSGKTEGEGEATAEGTGKGILGKVGEKVTQSAQYVKESVQSKAVTDPANPDKVDVQQTAKSMLKTVGEKVSQGTAYVRDAALTRAGPYSQGPVDTAPETGLINPSSVAVTDSVDLPHEPVAQSTQGNLGEEVVAQSTK